MICCICGKHGANDRRAAHYRVRLEQVADRAGKSAFKDPTATSLMAKPGAHDRCLGMVLAYAERMK